MKQKLSVVLATRNEEINIGDCIKSVLKIADEIIICDEDSTDNTRNIAKSLGARVFTTKHSSNFHKTKQLALEKAKNTWILQLDADERVTSQLAEEITQVINMDDSQIRGRKFPVDKAKLFSRHTEIFRSSGIYKDDGEIVAFLLPRLNYFLGAPLRGAGVYPDPAIRLVKKNKAYFPVKSVHENMVVDGATSWLFNDLEHYDSPTLERYLSRLNRYTDLQSEDFKKENLKLSVFNLIYYSTLKPFLSFLKLYFRHVGFKDGMRGFVWSVFSSLHFTIAYFKYWAKYKK